MLKEKKILIFPSGTEIAHEIYRSLRYEKNIELIGGSSISSHGDEIFSTSYNDIPFCHEKEFAPKINKIIKQHKIDFIFPAHDEALLHLSRNIASINAKIISSTPRVCEITRFKSKTYDALNSLEICPKLYALDESIEEWPIFSKPDQGQGSQGIAIIESQKDFESHTIKNPNHIYCEYLPGEEITVDCFTDRHGSLLYSNGRTRSLTRNGISIKSHSLDSESEDSKIENIARKILSRIPLRGVWFFQLKKDRHNQWKLLEIASRVSGTMGLNRAKGVNLPLMALYDAENIDITVLGHNKPVHVSRYLGSLYQIDIEYDTVYLDYDDTLIWNEQINPTLISFVAQARAKQKKVILLTRHQGNLVDSLKQYGLTPDFFDEVHHITDGKPKSFFIKNLSSIFIDDSFSERKEVYDATNIPCFSLESVETLFNWKTFLS
ncbi:MAG: ATP-grasp domain-containing protein [Bdellovibrionales bacterium]|nr:ATP-grasp domain-containing protein [Bdellovibrionales bacterium]